MIKNFEKYEKYKNEYKKLKNKKNMNGGFVITGLIFFLLTFALKKAGGFVLKSYFIKFLDDIKQYDECPREEESVRNPITGDIMWRGKKNLRKIIAKLLNSPNIKDNLETRELIKKYNNNIDISMNEFINILDKIYYKDFKAILKHLPSVFGINFSTDQTIINKIKELIECVSRSDTNSTIVHRDCLIGWKNDNTIKNEDFEKIYKLNNIIDNVENALIYNNLVNLFDKNNKLDRFKSKNTSILKDKINKEINKFMNFIDNMNNFYEYNRKYTNTNFLSGFLNISSHIYINNVIHQYIPKFKDNINKVIDEEIEIEIDIEI